MTIKKFRFFLVSNIEKEEKWLTEMSQRGLHYYKYKFGFYYFDEDPDLSYVYQTDFLQNADDAYFQLYNDAGWQHVMSYMEMFHYFRTEADKPGVKKIYSNPESVVESLQRMMKVYISIFFGLIAIQIPLIWMTMSGTGTFLGIFSNSIVFAVIILYVYLLISLKRKINFYQKKKAD